MCPRPAGYLAELLDGPRLREVLAPDRYVEKIREPGGVYLPQEGANALTRVLHYEWQGVPPQRALPNVSVKHAVTDSSATVSDYGYVIRVVPDRAHSDDERRQRHLYRCVRPLRRGGHLNDAALVLRSSDAPTDAVTLAGSLTAAMDVSMARGALYEVLTSEGWTPPERVTARMLADQHLRHEGTGSSDAQPSSETYRDGID